MQESIDKVAAILRAAGLDAHNIVSTQIYLSAAGDAPLEMQAYDHYVGSHRPAHLAFEVSRMPLVSGDPSQPTKTELLAVAWTGKPAFLPEIDNRVSRVSGAATMDRMYFALDGWADPTAEGLRSFLGDLSRHLTEHGMDVDHLASLTVVYDGSWDDATVREGFGRLLDGMGVAVSFLRVNALIGRSTIAVSAVAALDRQALDGNRPGLDSARLGDTLFCGTSRGTGATTADATRHSLVQLASSASAHGFSIEDAAFVNVFLGDLTQFAAMNEVYGTYFSEPPPARATVELQRPASPSSMMASMVLARSR